MTFFLFSLLEKGIEAMKKYIVILVVFISVVIGLSSCTVYPSAGVAVGPGYGTYGYYGPGYYGGVYYRGGYYGHGGYGHGGGWAHGGFHH